MSQVYVFTASFACFPRSRADHPVVRNIGGPLGIRSALVAGAAGSSSLQNEIAAVQRDAVHLLIGTPAKLNEVMAAKGVTGGSDCRLLVVSGPCWCVEIDRLLTHTAR